MPVANEMTNAHMIKEIEDMYTNQVNINSKIYKRSSLLGHALQDRRESKTWKQKDFPTAFPILKGW